MARPTSQPRDLYGIPGLATLALFVAGCDGPQSALVPAGRGAEQIASLWWWMAGGALLVWAAMVALAMDALRAEPKDERRASGWIVFGGAVFPALVLAALLILSLSITPGLIARRESADLVSRHRPPNQRGGSDYAHIMLAIAPLLTDGEIDSIAAYYASLGNRE